MATIFWDIENCQVKKDVFVVDIIDNLINLVNKIDITNTISEFDNIEVVGKTKTFRNGLVNEFINCGISINKGVNLKNQYKAGAADNELINSMHEFMHNNELCGKVIYYVILISGDSDFIRVLKTVKKMGFKVLVIHSDYVSNELKEIADVAVLWSKVNIPRSAEITDENNKTDENTVRINDVNISKPAKKRYKAAITCEIAPLYCKVRLYFNNYHSNYWINCDVQVGDIVQVEDVIPGYENGWSIGEIVKIYNNLKVVPTLQVIKVYEEFELINFHKTLHAKLTNDRIILNDVRIIKRNLGLDHIKIIACELRWDETNITILYTNIDPIYKSRFTKFNEFMTKLRSKYDIFIQLKYVRICPNNKCIDKFCMDYHR